MKITVGSPKPASDSCSVSTPVAHSKTETPTATIAMGILPVMNATTAMPRINSVVSIGVTPPQ